MVVSHVDGSMGLVKYSWLLPVPLGDTFDRPEVIGSKGCVT